jgi:tripartite-type tricarboxylate transporter receptor subunit TctC
MMNRFKYALILIAANFLLLPAYAQPLNYPAKPVQVIVPVTPGGATDIVTRAYTNKLGELWNQRIVVEHKPGGNGQIGATFVAKAEPDGYTLLATAETTLVINPSLFKSLSYDPFNDFVPIAGLGLINQILLVNPAVPAKSVQELIALAKTKPDELTYSTFGIGSTAHLNMAMFLNRAGIKMQAVHYRGGAPALEAVIGGHVNAIMISVGQAAGPWDSGRVRALAAGSKQRLPEFPDLPTIAESGIPGFEAVAYFALVAPKGTRPEIVTKINADVQRISSDPVFKEKFFTPNRYEPVHGSPQEFTNYMRADAEKWADIIKQLGIKIE